MLQLKALIFSIILSVSSIYAQQSEKCEISNFIITNKINLQIVGNVSDQYVNVLFANFPKTKRKGHIWKFKNVNIPGIEDKLTFHVYQGLYGIESETTDSVKTCQKSYFRAFTNKKTKQNLLKNQTESEQKAIFIYIKKGRKYALENREQTQLVKNYLLSLKEKFQQDNF